MSDKYSPKKSKPDELDDSFGENPAYPGRKRPSDWGAGKNASHTPGDAEQSPTSKTGF
jgi:hypothetical protein